MRVFLSERLTAPGGFVSGPFDALPGFRSEVSRQSAEHLKESLKNARVKQIGDWRLTQAGATTSTWQHKGDRDSNASKLTDTVMLPANAATSPASVDFYKQRLTSIRADRIHCAKTGKGCDKGNEGNVFTAATKELGKTATTIGKALDPKTVLDQIPGVKELSKYLPEAPNPLKMSTDIVDAAAHGDLERMKSSTLAVGHLVANVVSMIPAIGNVIGGPLSAALTLIETGNALKAALSLLLNEIPGIPPQIRDILRVAFNAIVDIIEGGQSVTDILLYQFKEGVRAQAEKSGISGPIADLIESVLAAAIQVIFQSKPLDAAALDLAEQGLEVARENVAKGVKLPAELVEIEQTVSDMRKVYKDIGDTYAHTQDIIRLVKQDPRNLNPAIQKQIRDLRAIITSDKKTAQAAGNKADASFKKIKPAPAPTAPKLRKDLPPTYRAPAAARAPAPPKLRSDLPPTYRPPSAPAKSPAPKAPAKSLTPTTTPLRLPSPKTPAPAQARVYGPYPRM